jgi:hypothetical protein
MEGNEHRPDRVTSSLWGCPDLNFVDSALVTHNARLGQSDENPSYPVSLTFWDQPMVLENVVLLGMLDTILTQFIGLIYGC